MECLPRAVRDFRIHKQILAGFVMTPFVNISAIPTQPSGFPIAGTAIT